MLGHLPNRKRSNLLLKKKEKKKKKYWWYSIHLAEIHVCFCKLAPYYRGSKYFLSFPGFIVQLKPVLSVHSCFNVYRAVIFSDRCPAAPILYHEMYSDTTSGLTVSSDFPLYGFLKSSILVLQGRISVHCHRALAEVFT